MVKVYSTPTCRYCPAVKRWLSDHNIEFSEVDVSSDESAFKELSDRQIYSVPVVEVDGKFIVGFNQRDLSAALL